MAQRRMFSKDITEHDSFLDMPLSSQALYFHLGMQADDDGFVSPNRIARMLGCQADDLKLLIAKKFVILFDDGVVVIKHWKMNNYIQKDRYTPTKHVENMALLQVKSNNGYKLDTECIQNVRVGKVSIGKSKVREELVKDSLDNSFDEFWSAYPVKKGKGNAEKSWDKLKPDLQTVLAAVKAQKTTDQWTKDNGKFIPYPATWLNQKRWEDEVEIVTSSKYSKYDS